MEGKVKAEGQSGVERGRYRTVRWERERRNLPMSLTAVDAIAGGAQGGRTNPSLKKRAKPNGPNCISTIEILWPVLGWELTGLK